jgi:hypothetical protein
VPSLKTLAVASSRNVGYVGSGRIQGATPPSIASYTYGTGGAGSTINFNSLSMAAYSILLVFHMNETTSLTSTSLTYFSYGSQTFTNRYTKTVTGRNGNSTCTLDYWYTINNSATPISAQTLSCQVAATYETAAAVAVNISGCYLSSPFSIANPYASFQNNSTASQATNTFSTGSPRNLAIAVNSTNDKVLLGYVTTTGWSGIISANNIGSSNNSTIYASNASFTSTQTNNSITTGGVAAGNWISIVDSLQA